MEVTVGVRGIVERPNELPEGLHVRIYVQDAGIVQTYYVNVQMTNDQADALQREVQTARRRFENYLTRKGLVLKGE